VTSPRPTSCWPARGREGRRGASASVPANLSATSAAPGPAAGRRRRPGSGPAAGAASVPGPFPAGESEPFFGVFAKERIPCICEHTGIWFRGCEARSGGPTAVRRASRGRGLSSGGAGRGSGGAGRGSGGAGRGLRRCGARLRRCGARAQAVRGAAQPARRAAQPARGAAQPARRGAARPRQPRVAPLRRRLSGRQLLRGGAAEARAVRRQRVQSGQSGPRPVRLKQRDDL
jgi:hypothetical protein